jgi:hypothetical protein
MGSICYSCHWKKEKVKISDGFSYTIRRYNNYKFEEIIGKFIKHWNEKHKESFLSLICRSKELAAITKLYL